MRAKKCDQGSYAIVTDRARAAIAAPDNKILAHNSVRAPFALTQQ